MAATTGVIKPDKLKRKKKRRPKAALNREGEKEGAAA
jgi:hypothetical protein